MDKSNQPMTMETVMGLFEAVRRINDAIEGGRMPNLRNAFERNVYHRGKEWLDMGNGSIHKGFEKWARDIKRREEKRKLDSPIWRLLVEMYESPNPYHRTLAEIVGERFSFAEFSRLTEETLAKEKNKSAQELPGVTPIKLTPWQPWESSQPRKRERDRIIWEMRNDKYTWDQIADTLSVYYKHVGITTIKENYDRMQGLSKTAVTRMPSKRPKKSV